MTSKKRPHGQDTNKVHRTTFRTSRAIDYFSEKELVTQTGHGPQAWPLVVLKELLDNALDACEEAGTPPNINVKVTRDAITVGDNGPGLPADTVKGVLDFSIRVSSREAYVAPDRGAQGNALKTIIAMPLVLDGEKGEVEIAGSGTTHRIILRVDPIRQVPVVNHEQTGDENAKSGTSVTVYWPNSACSILADAKSHFLQIASAYTYLNPHLTLTVAWMGEQTRFHATAPDWAKWVPSRPTSPQWYTQEQCERLIAAYVAHDQDAGQDRTVREFIVEFAGLTGRVKQKAVLDETGLSRKKLSFLRNSEGLQHDIVTRLLGAMQQHSKPIRPAALGIIGRAHLKQRFEDAGCEMKSFDYRKDEEVIDGVPCVTEAAFGWCPDAERRRLITGVNFSPGIINPFRELGRFGQSLDTVLEKQRASHSEPVIFLLHAVCPSVSYTDRGKSAVVIEE